MKKKSLLSLLVVAVIILVLIWVIVFSVDNGEEEVIKIGVITPLTTEMSNWGESMKGGVEIALEERNNIKGEPVEVIFEDNKACDLKDTVSAMRKLIDIDNVKVIMVGCSGPTLAAAPIAEENKVILLTPMASAAKISEAGDYIFRTVFSDTKQGKILGQYLIEEFNFSKVGVIYVNNDYGVGLFENLKNSFEGLGGEIVQAEKYEFATTDFRTNLIKIKSKSPEALVIIPYSGRDGGLIAKQAKELEMNLQIIGSENFGVPETIESGREAVEGAVFTTAMFDEEDPKIKELKEKFIEKYSKEPSILFEVAEAYDATNLLLNAIEKKGYNPEAIKTYLYSVKDYQGVSGIITIDENGDADKPIGLQMIKNGEFVKYEKSSLFIFS